MSPTFTEDQAEELVGGLVRIDSQNPDLVAGASGEAAIAAHCVEWLTAHGVDAWIDELAPGRHNAVARVGSGTGPVLVLCAHLDTVSADGMEIPPFEPRVEAGRLYGRGAYDMKGSVAAILAAMAALQTRELRGTVMAALVADEEFASIGATDFVQRYPADACIVTEPCEERLILAHKGFAWVEITTTGVAAHGSRWQDGVSAVGRMGRIIAALEHHDATVLRARTHPLVGPASLHCATVHGGDAWSTYSAECTLRVERRTLPGEDVDAVTKEIAQVIEEAGEQATQRVVLSRSPLECDPGSEIATAVSEAVIAAGGAAPEVAGVAYWMDAAIFADAGMATVNFGPGGAGAHAAIEWVDLASVVRCSQVLEAAAARYCG